MSTYPKRTPIMRAPDMRVGVPAFVDPARADEYIQKKSLYDQKQNDLFRAAQSRRVDKSGYVPMNPVTGTPMGIAPSPYSPRSAAMRTSAQTGTGYGNEMRYYSPEESVAFTRAGAAPEMVRQEVAAGQQQIDQTGGRYESEMKTAEAERAMREAERIRLATETQQIAQDSEVNRDLTRAQTEGVRTQNKISVNEDERRQQAFDLDVEWRGKVDPYMLEQVKQQVEAGNLSLQDAAFTLDQRKEYEPRERDQALRSNEVPIQRSQWELEQDKIYTPQERKIGIRQGEAAARTSEGMVVPIIESAQIDNESRQLEMSIRKREAEIAEARANQDIEREKVLQEQQDHDRMRLQQIQDAQISRELTALDLQNTRSAQEIAMAPEMWNEGNASELLDRAISVSESDPELAQQLFNEYARKTRGHGGAPAQPIKASMNTPATQARVSEMAMQTAINSGLNNFIESGALENIAADAGKPSDDTLADMRALVSSLNSALSNASPDVRMAIVNMMRPQLEKIVSQHKKHSYIKRVFNPGYMGHNWRNTEDYDEAEQLAQQIEGYLQ